MDEKEVLKTIRMLKKNIATRLKEVDYLSTLNISHEIDEKLRHNKQAEEEIFKLYSLIKKEPKENNLKKKS